LAMKTLTHWYNGLAGQPISFDPAIPQMNTYLAALERRRAATMTQFTPRTPLTRPITQVHDEDGSERRAA
jgi:hypothetical protein